MSGPLSDQTTSFSNLSLTGQIAASGYSADGATLSALTASRVTTTSLQASMVTVTSRISTPQISAVSVLVPGGINASGVTFDLRTNSVLISTHTRADASGLTIGQLGIVFAASGISLVFSSGKSVYIIGGSATSGAQA